MGSAASSTKPKQAPLINEMQQEPDDPIYKWFMELADDYVLEEITSAAKIVVEDSKSKATYLDIFCSNPYETNNYKDSAFNWLLDALEEYARGIPVEKHIKALLGSRHFAQNLTFDQIKELKEIVSKCTNKLSESILGDLNLVEISNIFMVEPNHEEPLSLLSQRFLDLLTGLSQEDGRKQFEFLIVLSGLGYVPIPLFRKPEIYDFHLQRKVGDIVAVVGSEERVEQVLSEKRNIARIIAIHDKPPLDRFIRVTLSEGFASQLVTDIETLEPSLNPSSNFEQYMCGFSAQDGVMDFAYSCKVCKDAQVFYKLQSIQEALGPPVWIIGGNYMKEILVDDMWLVSNELFQRKYDLQFIGGKTLDAAPFDREEFRCSDFEGVQLNGDKMVIHR